jgi:hypothetical protein
MTNLLDAKGIVTGVIVAALLGVVAILWSWTSGGGLIHFLGGVTSADLEKVRGATSVDLEKFAIPAGALMEFDLPKCPVGWELPYTSPPVSVTVNPLGASTTGTRGQNPPPTPAPWSPLQCKKEPAAGR